MWLSPLDSSDQPRGLNHTPNPMNTESNTLSRREALMRALKSAVTAAVVAPIIVEASPSAPDTEFVPENDYPFFGGEIPEGYRSGT